MESDINTENESPEPSKAGLARARLKLVAHYAMLAFAPVVAILALIVAVTAGHDRTDQVQHGEYASRIDSLNAALSDAKGDVESLKVILAREKSIREEERKRTDRQDQQIIQAIDDLQAKLKISPTLSEQLQGAAAPNAPVPAAASAISAPVAAPVPKEAVRQAPAVPASAVAAEKKPAAQPKRQPVGAGKQTHAAPAATPKKDGKQSDQVEAMKKAIEQFNKQ